jgi:hypothetical protein
MIFNIITKTKYGISKGRIVFDNILLNSRFGEIYCNEHLFKFGWNSENIIPKIIEINNNVYAIGIDQYFAIIDFNTGYICLNYDLFYNLYDLKVHQNNILIATELEILILNKFNYSILKKVPLLEFYDDIDFDNNKFKIRTIDGNIKLCEI